MCLFRLEWRTSALWLRTESCLYCISVYTMICSISYMWQCSNWATPTAWLDFYLPSLSKEAAFINILSYLTCLIFSQSAPEFRKVISTEFSHPHADCIFILLVCSMLFLSGFCLMGFSCSCIMNLCCASPAGQKHHAWGAVTVTSIAWDTALSAVYMKQTWFGLISSNSQK